jgi:GR25 family glycosyltransferase involved in LPS biosynthesis
MGKTRIATALYGAPIMSVNTFFDHIYCLNLDRRTDRWARCEEVFVEYRIENIERFSASDGLTMPDFPGVLKGNVGLFDSHRRILQDAIDKDYHNILIFEDDVEFHPDFNNIFTYVEQEISDNWNTLYLGCNLHGGGNVRQHRVSEHLYLANKVLTTHAIAISSHMFHPILESIIFERPKDLSYADWSMDVLYLLWSDTPHSYIVIPRIAFQRSDYSDIIGQNVNYDFLKDD